MRKNFIALILFLSVTLGLVKVGDAGVDKAAKNANIKEISYIDVREQTIFIFFKKITTTVYGK